jgi:excisionase family DNA binding protein
MHRDGPSTRVWPPLALPDANVDESGCWAHLQNAWLPPDAKPTNNCSFRVLTPRHASAVQCRHMTTQILLSKKDAADALAISVRMIDYLISTKQLAVTRIGKRVLVSRKALEALARGK